MARAFKAFSDFNGQTVELGQVLGMSNKMFAERFPGVKGRRFDSFEMQVGFDKSKPLFGSMASLMQTAALPVTRLVAYKARPSLHACDARCMQAKGRTMECECACGGRNHGKG